MPGYGLSACAGPFLRDKNMKLHKLTENLGYSHFDVVSPETVVKSIDTSTPGFETSKQELAWVGKGTQKQIARGTDKEVKIDIPEGTHEWVVHTHPTDDNEPSIFNALPSKQDLETAIKIYEHDVPGMVIFSGDNFVIVSATNKAYVPTNYESIIEDAYHEGDIQSVIKKLRTSGFQVGVGQR